MNIISKFFQQLCVSVFAGLAKSPIRDRITPNDSRFKSLLSVMCIHHSVSNNNSKISVCVSRTCELRTKYDS